MYEVTLKKSCGTLILHLLLENEKELGRLLINLEEYYEVVQIDKTAKNFVGINDVCKKTKKNMEIGK